jgi:homogentisate phytyltransferase/homogentisate geranylgeranyltransferase
VDAPTIAAVGDGDTGSAEPQQTPAPSTLPERLGVLYRFSRPHTMLGTAISVASISALALGPGDATARVALRVGAGLAAALLMNVAIVGVNQVYDVEIDKVREQSGWCRGARFSFRARSTSLPPSTPQVNKPYLPIPAGDLTVPQAVRLSTVAGAASLAVGAVTRSPPLLATLAGSLALGLAYSTAHPLLRWKRHPAAAAACILAVRSVAVQGGFFAHALRAADRAAPLALPPPLAFAVCMTAVFGVAIALLKDVPDVAGDAAASVRTLAVRVGAPSVLRGAAALLGAAYAAAIAFAATRPPSLARTAAILGHAAAGAALARAAARADGASPASAYAFYMRVWSLFYLEYALVPLMR